jgi:eukaryotic-like serine/threonine-protein kinase
MAPNLSGVFTLNEGVLIIPVSDLPEESRNSLECDPADFAVSRLQSRTGSKVIDPDAADLLSRFRDQHTIVEAVILFAREKELDPGKVLEGAYPFLRDMVTAGFLVSSGHGTNGQDGPQSVVQFNAGARVLDALVLRTLQVLEDTEVYLLSRENDLSVLKIERLSPNGIPGPVRARLRHEAAYLAHLAGSPTPTLLGEGELEGRAYLEMEFVQGVDAATAAAEWRERKETGQAELLHLGQNIARTYAALHERGILHGDVHPSNILVERNGNIRLIDFGVARATNPATPLPMPPDRGGIPFFFEPELASASLAGLASSPASNAGEQHAIAALLYFLVTGNHWQNFRLGRGEMLQDIAGLPPLSFRERGAKPWPEFEALLARGLAKRPDERFPSMSSFAEALDALTVSPSRKQSGPSSAPLAQLLERSLANAAWDGPWSNATFTTAPTTSINYGSAGVALGLLQVALRRNDGTLLALADTWSRRATREIGPDEAFYSEEVEITPEMVGKSSPYHSPSGVHAIAVLTAAAASDPAAQAEGLAAFLLAAQEPAAGLDLTLGRTSVLLGAAILLDAIPPKGFVDVSPLRALGDSIVTELWEALDAKPEIKDAGIEYLGIAHGWAGFLYATLQWCSVSGATIPQGVARRLRELAAFALPVNRGLDWPWVLGQTGEPLTMSGWCNGACGYVFLWTLAHRLLGDPLYLELAQGAAWRSWEAPEPVVTLCCGLAGRAYALLNLYRHSQDTVWFHRARDLAIRAAAGGHAPKEYPHSLYKGEFGLAVLAADLEQPDEASMPFFEPMGYHHARPAGTAV